MIKLQHAPVGPEGGHIAGRRLLDRMYREHFGKSMPTLVTGRYGKPCFADGSVHFSISHTPRHVFCVLSDRPVGIDAEECDREISLALADRILSPPELRRYRAAADKKAALLRLWVLKEAAVKQTGLGLRGYPNDTDFSPDDPKIQIIDGCFVAVIGE